MRKTDLDYDRVVALYREHGSLVKVAKVLGISDRTITRHRQADADFDRALSQAREEFLEDRRQAKPHGTRARYVTCTEDNGRACAACRKANTVEQNARNAERRTRPRARVPHGLNGYVNYGCKCQICTAAKTKHMREYRNRLAQRLGGAA